MNEELDEPKSSAKIDGGGVVVIIVCLVTGVAFLLPGGFCSVAGIAMGVSGDDWSIAVLFLAIGLPCALFGLYLLRAGWRRFRRT